MPRRRRDPARPPGRVAPHFARDGAPKTSYRTRAEAQSAAHFAWTMDRVELDAYRCDHCHQWHIGRRFRDQ